MPQAAIHAHPLVEHETLAVIVLAAAVLEILENAAVELQDGLEAGLLHERSRLLATDAARAEQHDRLFLQPGCQPRDGRGELAEVIDPDGERIPEGPELHLVV